MKTSLTEEQRKVLRELDRIADFGTAPKRTYLKPTAFKLFRQIMHKKVKFPDAVADVPVEDDKYRGIQICAWPPTNV